MSRPNLKSSTAIVTAHETAVRLEKIAVSLPSNLNPTLYNERLLLQLEDDVEDINLQAKEAGLVHIHGDLVVVHDDRCAWVERKFLDGMDDDDVEHHRAIFDNITTDWAYLPNGMESVEACFEAEPVGRIIIPR